MKKKPKPVEGYLDPRHNPEAARAAIRTDPNQRGKKRTKAGERKVLPWRSPSFIVRKSGTIAVVSPMGKLKGWRESRRRGALCKEMPIQRSNREALQAFLAQLPHPQAKCYRIGPATLAEARGVTERRLAGMESGKVREQKASHVEVCILALAAELLKGGVKRHLLAGKIAGLLAIEHIKRSERTVRDVLKRNGIIKVQRVKLVNSNKHGNEQSK